MRKSEVKEITETEKKKQAERTRRADEYLRGYTLHKRMLRLEGYEKKRALSSEWEEYSPGELPLARARMFEVRHTIMSLPNCDEKLILYYRYVKGEPVERCADMLGMSRSSAFRLRRRALVMIADKLGI